MPYIDSETRVIVQGITGSQGSFHARLMKDYGTNVVAGVTPGRGGQEVHGVPVYESVKEAALEEDADASVVFVPAPYALSAGTEAVTAMMDPVVVITEHIPIADELKLARTAEAYQTTLVGPNTPGVMAPGEAKMGIMPGEYFTSGETAVVSRSGTLTYEVGLNLSRSDMGQSLVFGCGGDPIVGTNFIEVFEELRGDDGTERIVVVGEIGGEEEERLAEYYESSSYPKPAVAYVAGKSAPPEKRMGHAGAIISGETGTAQSKVEAFKEAGIEVATKPSEIPGLVRSA